MEIMMQIILNNHFKALKCDSECGTMKSLQNTVFAVGKEN